MKNQKQLTDLNSLPLKEENYCLKTERLRTEPRPRIRQLIRSSIPPETFKKEQKSDQETQQ